MLYPESPAGRPMPGTESTGLRRRVQFQAEKPEDSLPQDVGRIAEKPGKSCHCRACGPETPTTNQQGRAVATPQPPARLPDRGLNYAAQPSHNGPPAFPARRGLQEN